MRAITLAYHDIVDAEAESRMSRQKLRYRLNLADFSKHLACIHTQAAGAVEVIDRPRKWGAQVPVLITFDDGALSSYTIVADELERFGWRGIFFVTTDWIGQSGFMSKAQIRELHERGHVIGSHTCSHPARMSSLTREQLLKEWTVSRKILGDIVGAPVRTASVADGFYSRRVGSAAAASGIQVLFTSEPTVSISDVEGCMIFGRYVLQRQMRPEISGWIAAGRKLPRWREAILWQAKKPFKALTGDSYLAIRSLLLSRGQANHRKAESA